MSGRYATEQAFFDDRQRLVCGCIRTCAGHDDTDDPLGIKAAQRIANGHHKLSVGNFDVRMDKVMNPKSLPIHIMSALISADRCPACLGNLDTGYECNECHFDAQPWLKASIAINNAAFDKREG